MDLGDAAESTSRDLWMEVMLKLVTVAIVQAWPQRALGVSCRKSTVECRPLRLALLQVLLGIKLLRGDVSYLFVDAAFMQSLGRSLGKLKIKWWYDESKSFQTCVLCSFC